MIHTDFEKGFIRAEVIAYADYLVMRGLRVTHLVALDNAQKHALNSIARVDHGMLVYDGKTQLGLGL